MRNVNFIRRAAITIILATLVVMFVMLFMCSCHANNTKADVKATLSIGDKLSENQPTPTDIDYSLERYNLIKRAYWVNGQREKANTLVCAVEKPLGYIVLFTDAGGVVGSFVVDGKVSSLNSFLTPDSMYYEAIGDYVANGKANQENEWLPDVDGSYGENDAGIFFFTTDGKYIEWTGTYLYSDILFIVDDPIVKIGE